MNELLQHFVHWLWVVPFTIPLLGCIGSGNSSASQAQTTATGEGVVQGHTSTSARDNSVAVGANTKITSGNIAADRGSTVNVGLQASDVQGLLGQVTQASQAQIDAASTNSQQQLAAIEALAQNAQAGTNLTLAKQAMIFGGVVILAFLFFFRRKS